MLNTLRAALIGLTAAGPAAANHERGWPASTVILVPPPNYDPWRRPYSGKLTIRFVPHAQVYQTCITISKNPSRIGPRVLACAIPFGTARCTIVMPVGMPADLLRAIRRHEVGHCKGWSHANTTGEVQSLNEDDHLHHGDMK